MRKKGIVIILLIAMIIEIFICNITFFYSLKGRRNIKKYENVELMNYTDNFAVLKVSDINCKTYSVKIDFSSAIEEPEAIEYKVFFSDDTTSEYIGLKSKWYVKENEKSKYMPLYLSGNCKSLLVYVNKDFYDAGAIESITINETIPFQFHLIRFIIVFGALILLYAINYAEVFRAIYSSKEIKQEIILLGVMAVFIAIMAFLNIYSSSEGKKVFSTEMQRFI